LQLERSQHVKGRGYSEYRSRTWTLVHKSHRDPYTNLSQALAVIPTK